MSTLAMADGCKFSWGGGTSCRFNVDTGGSELAHMWYVTLGEQAVRRQYRPNVRVVPRWRRRAAP
jgi:hypothetical protein